MVEELKLAIKVDDDAIEQSLLKQFANAEKMANKVVLTFNNIDLDDKAIEAKFKEMQKMAGKNPIDLSIDKSSIEMLSAISKQLGNIFNIAKGKSIIDSSAIDNESIKTAIDLFSKIESSISTIRKVFADVGDGEEFSPLLKMINDVQKAVSSLEATVSKIKLNVNIETKGSDEQLLAKIEQRKQVLLNAYRDQFNAMRKIKPSGADILNSFGLASTSGSTIAALNKSINMFDESEIDNIDQKISAYEDMIKKMKRVSELSYGTNIYDNMDKTFQNKVSSAKGSLTKAMNSLDNDISDGLGGLFGQTDLSGVISQLEQIVKKLEEISSSATEFKNIFKEGFNVTASVEEIDKLTDRVKELEDELAKIKLNPVDINKPNVSSGTQIEDVFQGDANVNTDASTTAIKEESQALDQVSTSAKDAATSKEKFANANKEVKASADNSKTSISEEEKYFNSLGKSLTQYQNTLTSISRKPTDGNRSQELQEKIDIISSSLKELETLKSKTEENGYIFNKNDVDTGKQLEKTIKENIELVKQMSAAQKGSDTLSRGKEIDTITKYLNKFTGISKEAKQELNVLLDQLRSGDPSVNVKKIHERFLELTVAERNAGREARNLFDIFKDKKIYSFLGQAASMFSFYDLINYGREGISTLKEFDDGLTKISYTMDMTKSKLNDLGKSVLEMANDLDSSIDNAMQVSQIYANMNTSAEEIKKLSEPTLILSNLTGFDASTVADDIQAVTQQFEIAAEDSMHIADVYDQISRNISVDYGKGIESIAEAVQVAGSTANQAGLSFEQLAAIVGKTAEKTRLDGSQIGNGLKTIMTRLSKVGELSDEVDPETLSDASESLHKIGIEVYNADGSFRKFDVIMGELANKWDTLSDAEKSNISFSIAATRQTNLLSSILSNFSDSMSMAEEATNANGNALENNQKWVDSFSGRLQALENTAKSAWINILDSETLATGIDLLNGLLKVSTEIINTFGAIPTVFTTGGIGAFIANFTWPSMATNNYNLSYSF